MINKLWDQRSDKITTIYKVSLERTTSKENASRQAKN
jgi:hypothetical protein